MMAFQPFTYDRLTDLACQALTACIGRNGHSAMETVGPSFAGETTRAYRCCICGAVVQCQAHATNVPEIRGPAFDARCPGRGDDDR